MSEIAVVPSVRHRRLPRGAGATIGLPLAFGIFVLAAWQVLVRLRHVPQLILPAPSDVAHVIPGTFGILMHHALVTGGYSVAAFAIAVALGFVTAVVLSSSAIVFETFYPHVLLIQLTPKIALAPLFTFWLGLGATSRLTYAVFISFFPVALATMTGLSRTDANALRLCRAVGASAWQTFVWVRLPYALPYFMTGVKVAATMSVIGIVIGEFISSKEGLGYYILLSGSFGRTANVFAGLAVLCVVGLLLYAVAFAAERRLQRWWRG